MSFEEENAIHRKPFPWTEIVLAAIAALTLGYYGYTHIKTARTEATTVVARVNGAPIYLAELNRGFSSDSFESTTSELKRNKLERLINQAAVKQFLAGQKVHVSEKLVDKEIEKLEKNPPSQGCPCCTYPSLAAYLSTIGYTLDNLRLEIRNNLGLMDYARKSWKKSHKNKADLLAEIGREGDYVREHYVNAWQIFFNTFQQPGFDADPGKIRKEARSKALKAWERLEKGESFASVAKSVSEDMTSKKKGGYLGPTDKSSYGREFEEAVEKQPAGEYGKPFDSSWGCHIMKWQPMTDDDILEFCESYFVQKEYQQLVTQITEAAKIERIEQSDM